MPNPVDTMLEHYIVCAFWSSTHDEEPMDGLDLELHLNTIGQMRADCQSFYDAEYTDAVAALWTLEQFGHDFWLTRNHHGAGFWDRGHGDIGDHLSKAAHVYGSVDLYVGDDGEVHA